MKSSLFIFLPISDPSQWVLNWVCVDFFVLFFCFSFWYRLLGSGVFARKIKSFWFLVLFVKFWLCNYPCCDDMVDLKRGIVFQLAVSGFNFILVWFVSFTKLLNPILGVCFIFCMTLTSQVNKQRETNLLLVVVIEFNSYTPMNVLYC